MATVELVLLAVDAPVMMFVAPTLIAVTVVLVLPENLTVAVWFPTVVTTIGNPAADAGPVTVTTLPLAVALKPAALMIPATLDATAVELVERADGPLVISTPFTLMLVTDVLTEPLNVIVALGNAGVALTTGRTAAADPGPVIVTVLPDAVAAYPLAVTSAAVVDASVLELVVDAVAPLMMFVPLTRIPVTDVPVLPENTIVA